MEPSPHWAELAAYHEPKEVAREVDEDEEDEEEDVESSKCDGGGTSEQRNA